MSIVYNYSNVELTPGMESLLNKGMGFVPVTSKVNISQILQGEKVEFSEEQKALEALTTFFLCDQVGNNGLG